MTATHKVNSHLHRLASSAISEDIAGLARSARSHIATSDEPAGGAAAAEALISTALAFAAAGRAYLPAADA